MLSGIAYHCRTVTVGLSKMIGRRSYMPEKNLVFDLMSRTYLLHPIQDHFAVRNRPSQPQADICPSQEPQSGMFLIGAPATGTEIICMGKNAARVRSRFMTGEAFLNGNGYRHAKIQALARTSSLAGVQHIPQPPYRNLPQLGTFSMATGECGGVTQQ